MHGGSASNPSTFETEAGVQDYLWLLSELEVSLGYIRLCLEK